MRVTNDSARHFIAEIEDQNAYAILRVDDTLKKMLRTGRAATRDWYKVDNLVAKFDYSCDYFNIKKYWPELYEMIHEDIHYSSFIEMTDDEYHELWNRCGIRMAKGNGFLNIQGSTMWLNSQERVKRDGTIEEFETCGMGVAVLLDDVGSEEDLNCWDRSNEKKVDDEEYIEQP